MICYGAAAVQFGLFEQLATGVLQRKPWTEMVDRSSFARPANLAEASYQSTSQCLSTAQAIFQHNLAAGHRQATEEHQLLQSELPSRHCFNHCCDHGHQSQVVDCLGLAGTSMALPVCDQADTLGHWRSNIQVSMHRCKELSLLVSQHWQHLQPPAWCLQ